MDDWIGWSPSEGPLAGSRGEATSAWLVSHLELGSAQRLELELSALGTWVEPWLDGQQVGDARLLPANSPPELGHVVERIDLGELSAGPHVLGLWTGGGYNADYSRWGWRWTEQSRVLARLVGPDGRVELGGWRWAPSPVVEASLYGGEVFDSRLLVDFCAADHSSWTPCVALPAPQTPQWERHSPQVRVVSEFDARPVGTGEHGRVLDLGQNIAGHVRLRVRGRAGDRVTVHHAEELWPDGRLDARTNRSAAATDTLVLAGGEQVWEPRFTHHGFRYLEVAADAGVEVVQVTGREVRADLAERGHFECSDDLVNQIWSNNRRSIATNTLSFPTDTPVRDERTPPPLDVLATHEAALLEFDMTGVYRDYLRALPTWEHLPDMGGPAITLPWAMYLETGEVDLLAENLPAMADWFDQTCVRLTDGVWPDGGWAEGNGFGDWAAPLPPDQAHHGEGRCDDDDCLAGSYQAAFSEVPLVNHALLVHDARLLCQAAKVVGDEALRLRAHRAALALKRLFHMGFWRADHYSTGRQVTSILPLALDLAPSRYRPDLARALAGAVAGAGNHLDTGIFGTRYLLEALAGAGLDDLGPVMLRQQDYPGFGYQIARGATTPWEHWCYAGTMVSHNHSMFAGINASLYQTWAGIRASRAGWAAVRLDPRLPVGIDLVSARLETPRGLLSVRWERTEHGLSGTIDSPTAVTLRGQRLRAGTHRVNLDVQRNQPRPAVKLAGR